MKVFSKINWVGNFFRFLHISRRDIVKSSTLAFFSSLLEGFGVAMMLPVLQYVQFGQGVFQAEHVNRFWKILAWVSSASGIGINLPILLCVTFSVILTRATVLYFKGRQTARIENRSVKYLRQRIFQSSFAADYAFCESVGESGVTGLLTLESTRVGRILLSFFEWLGAVFGILFYLMLLCALSLPLTALALATFVLIQLFLAKRIRATKIAGRVVSQSNILYNFFIAQRMSASKLVRIFKTEDFEAEQFSQIVSRLEAGEMDVRQRTTFVQSQLDPILICGALVILYVGSAFLRLDFSSISIFLLVLLRMFPFSKTANQHFQSMLSLKSALDRIQKFLSDAEAAHTIQSGAKSFVGLQHGIVFKNVSFSYNAHKVVLQDLSFSWPKGSVLALVGQSGSGKSTIVDLILRLRDVQEGAVLVDDIDIKDLDLMSYRKAIGYVSQDAFLFNDTLYHNIVYGRTGIQPEAVEKACKQSHCFEFIQRFALGLETKVGDRGAMLSGGERQRICLARALVANPDLLILDEPTSALDSESESYINQTLAELKAMGKTILIIAHRFSTVKEADQILVMEHGKVVERGSHADLFGQGNNSLYKRLYELQHHVA